MEAAASAHANQSTSQQPQKNSFRDLFTFTAWRHCWLLVAGLVGAVLSGAFMTSMSILLGRIFAVISQFGSGHLTGAETVAEVSSWCVLLAVVGGAGFLVNFVFMFSWIAFSELQARNIRGKMFHGLLKKEMQWFDSQPDGVASLLIRIQTYSYMPRSKIERNTTTDSGSDRHASCRSHRPWPSAHYPPELLPRSQISSSL